MGRKRGAYQHKVRKKRETSEAKPIFAKEMREAFKAWRDGKGLGRQAITRAGVLRTGEERKARMVKRKQIAITGENASGCLTD